MLWRNPCLLPTLMRMNGVRYFVTGTDTAVGKTTFSALLLQQWKREGHRAIGFKPVSTGDREDARALHQAAGGAGEEFESAIPIINPCHFTRPISPWLAAEAEGKQIDVAMLVQHVSRESSGHTHALVEGAGGWLAPLSERETIRDLAVALGWPIIVVALARLGTLNHTLLTVESVQAAGLPVAAVVINSFGCAGDVAAPDAVGALRRLLVVPVWSMEMERFPLG